MRRIDVLPLGMLLIAGAVSRPAAQTKIKANDWVVNGESFFAAANIASELTRLAKADGYLDASVSVKQIAVSGAVMTGILSQYKSCTPKPTFLFTDGGGNDLMNSCGATATPDCAAIKSALNTVKQYFDEMKTGGTKKVIWMRYPDPYGSNWATLKTNQDVYNPEVEKICKASVEPKCLWIDMRTTWEGHYAQYTSDGIHPTTAGGTATAEAFWKFAKDNKFFDLAATGAKAAARPASGFGGQRIAEGALELSLSLAGPSAVAVRLTDLSGRTVMSGTTTAGTGPGTARFPLSALSAGIYRLDAQAGSAHYRSTVLVP
jgi:hypothetical protein